MCVLSCPSSLPNLNYLTALLFLKLPHPVTLFLAHLMVPYTLNEIRIPLLLNWSVPNGFHWILIPCSEKIGLYVYTRSFSNWSPLNASFNPCFSVLSIKHNWWMSTMCETLISRWPWCILLWQIIFSKDGWNIPNALLQSDLANLPPLTSLLESG